ncbi:TPA: hypothetical protein N2N50_002844 [Kluyvera ascorbata]|nr:hypothetical protein [Kluyvera ascorbata]HCL5621836.1 hypothetical protein [Kluyvera ascorbata]HDG1665729.1 hypothetical protein [Kluyvera ascorbata]HED3199905.1 hypothetical protein [Kluyvera ascorbata]HED4086454.1 hypothetical protein [Kluyvera ascorbata]
MGIAIDGDKTRNGESGRVSTKMTGVTTKHTEGQKKEWIIHGKLEKKKSPYRFHLL